MRMSQLFGRTIREVPKDAELPSHKLLLRAGLIRQYTAGIYGLLPLANRIVSKIEKIVREEMNLVGGQEIRMSCLSTKELWDESGRYSAVGKDMFRLKDRHERPMVLNMTHEEPVVFLARTELTSYKHLPSMVYQIQSKFRDEPRPRGGLIRLREFLMKDAYSFHESEEDLKNYYWQVHEAYVRIFKRVGLRNFVSVLSDNGMFGGRFSHEFQLLVPTGEDKLITCKACDYKANSEIATSPYAQQEQPSAAKEKVPTPGIKTIAALCKSLKIKPEETAKAVIYQSAEGKPIVAFIRGDLEIVDMKLRTLLGHEVFPAQEKAIQMAGAVAGSTGPLGLKLENCVIVIDSSVLKTRNVATGANEADMHWIHFDIHRDFLNTLSEQEKSKVLQGDVGAARAGDPCPQCGGELQESRGIEIGNIFHLGVKYTQAMDCTFLDQSGARKNHIMGCYGIGVTRLLPAVIEEHHDDRGPLFPIPVSPYEVHLCALNFKEAEVKTNAEKIYQDLKNQGIDVLFDDRDEKAGSQFADADLIGIPLRITVSPRSLAEGSVEFKYRDGREPHQLLKLTQVLSFISQKLDEEYSKFKL